MIFSNLLGFFLLLQNQKHYKLSKTLKPRLKTISLGKLNVSKQIGEVSLDHSVPISLIKVFNLDIFIRAFITKIGKLK